MAVLDSEESRVAGKKRKREAFNDLRKLLVDERVEVRSVEDGFRGSWHSGIVIACDKKRHRSIRYDHLLSDDNFGELTETVRVSPVLDGTGGERHNLRGLIRPLPPPAPAGICDLHYGLCVDAQYNEAWWEGVIFDCEDGSSKRRVFFPDLGDELMMEVDLLRITRDWDEATGEWEWRGSWALLEVVEEFEQDHGHALPVSMKQIWYDVRERRDFEKVREWTCGARELWKNMVMEVCDFYLELLAEELCRILKCPRSLVPDLMDSVGSYGSRSAWTGLDGIGIGIDPEVEQCSSDASVPLKITNDSLRQPDAISGVTTLVSCDVSALICSIASNTSQPIEAVGNLTQVSPSTQCNHDETPMEGIITKDSGEIIAEPGNSVSGNSGAYKPVSSDMLPAAEFCPRAVDEYLRLVRYKSQRSKSRASLFKDVWKHLSYLGWKIEHSKENGVARKRYTPPGGKCMYSLVEVCNHLTTSTEDLISSPSGDKPRERKDSTSAPRPLEEPRESRHPNSCPQPALLPASSLDPDYCLELYTEYSRNGGTVGPHIHRNLGVKAKEQLLTYGWIISTCYTSNGRPYDVYIPPVGSRVYSLKSACKAWCETKNATTSACKSTSRIKFILGSKDASIGNPLDLSKELSKEAHLDHWKVKVRGIRKARRQRDSYLFDFENIFQSQTNLHAKRDVMHSGSMKNGARSQLKFRNSTSSTAIKLKVAEDETQKTCVLRSSKRVRDVVIPSSSHRNPLSVVSWLVENGAILPRTKVHCFSRETKHKSMEGRINCRGIKCSCCMKIFTLSGFVVHAGRKNRKAVANIFLDDGRSIFDCAKLSVSRSKSLATEMHDKVKSKWSKGENDHICSVCQYGGELMLCDRCPAAFHKHCLGLRDIPEGDWFCRSCHCRKCGASNLHKGKEHTKDESNLTCSQCNHKYHIGCLNTRQLTKIKADPLNWFCGKTCKKIYYKLQKLLRKQTTLDTNNLTWSLLKPTKTNSHKPDSEIDEVESHIKLDNALTVIHECFKPVREARTKRDLVEDVIFSRESELQRLNFRGFYTAILSRNDELISVATFRIHGKEVAEVPLVGTRFQYRRLGMCRILMDELVKKLTQLGVERVVLPAVPSVLSTWTGSFGFSVMTAPERLHFLDYTFLDFQGTTMCQKLLTNNPVAELCPLNVMRSGLSATVCDDGDIDRSSGVSEVYQAQQTEDDQFASRGRPEFPTDHKAGTEISVADIVVRKEQNGMIRPCFDAIITNQDMFTDPMRRPDDGILFSKFYIRKKKPSGLRLVKTYQAID